MSAGTPAAIVPATVPWGCWEPEQQLELTFPPRFDVQINSMHDAESLSANELLEAVRAPIGSKALRELAVGMRTAVIAVDDITRPTPTADLLPSILAELDALPSENIRILVALGAHRPMVRSELERKLGRDLLNRFEVEQHHPYENLVDFGTSSRGTPIRLNRSFCEADLKIGVGGVMPHPYMGFGGGAKLVVPGLAGIETLQANHQPAVSGISGGLADPDVDARRDVEEIALKAGLNFSCNAVVNSRRQVAGFFCGHPVESHRAAARFASKIYATQTPAAPYDIVLLNAYPKDGELLQVGNAFNCYRTARQPLLKEGGTLVITARCELGRGYHSLHGLGMRLHRAPSKKPFLEGRDLVLFSPNISDVDFRVSFSAEYSLVRSWPDLMSYLDAKHSSRASVGVFPTAPLQIVG